jgi:hypothetical protein
VLLHVIENLEREYLADAVRIMFTKHAIEKFDVMRNYGFEIQRKQIIETILDPESLYERDNQFFATRGIESKHAVRVVYEKRKDYLVVITFYPVRRKRYGV